MPPFDPRAPTRHTVFGALAMIVFGLLIFLPSGLCTGWFGFGAVYEIVSEPSSGGEGLSLFFTALVIGGPFVLGGGLMIWFGIRSQSS